MSPEEIEQAIHKIAWGGRFIEAKDSEGTNRVLVIKSLSVRQRNFVNFIYDGALAEARREGVSTKFELYAQYKSSGVWTAKDDEKIEKLEGQIKQLKDIFETSSGRDKKKYDRQIERLENSYLETQNKRQALFSSSAESHANEARSMALIFCSTYDDQEKCLWSNWQAFLDEADDTLVHSVLNGIKDIDTYSVAKIREIARSGVWRFRWNGAKGIGDLFGKPISEFDAEQQGLLYWSQVYDSVYESMDKPPDGIIEDDEALDKWFEDKYRKDKAEEVANKGGIGKMKLSNKIRSSGEIFVVTNPNINPYAPSREDIDELNTEFIRKFKQAEVEKIQEHGVLNEKDLRDRKNRIARKVIGSSDALISKNSFGQAKGGKSAGTILPGGSIS